MVIIAGQRFLRARSIINFSLTRNNLAMNDVYYIDNSRISLIKKFDWALSTKATFLIPSSFFPPLTTKFNTYGNRKFSRCSTKVNSNLIPVAQAIPFSECKSSY